MGGRPSAVLGMVAVQGFPSPSKMFFRNTESMGKRAKPLLRYFASNGCFYLLDSLATKIRLLPNKLEKGIKKRKGRGLLLVRIDSRPGSWLGPTVPWDAGVVGDSPVARSVPWMCMT